MGPYGTCRAERVPLHRQSQGLERVPDLPKITAPTLITCGEHDELTPACALRMKLGLPNAELKVFANASHMPFYENPGDYYPALPRLPRETQPAMNPSRVLGSGSADAPV